MDLKYFNDESFKNSMLYQEFIDNNAGKGNLRIRAFVANEALPIEGLKVIVSTTLDNVKIVFFEGETDASGMIETISLPAPKINLDNLEVPTGIVYEVEAINDNFKQTFKVLMYDGVCVVQNIIPEWGNI